MSDIPRVFSLWVVIPVTAVTLGLVTEACYRIGRRARRRPSHENETATSDLSTPAVGLLGLMLAFTFGWAATRYDARNSARMEEAKQLANVFRLADFLPEPEHARARAVLREYLAVSLSASNAAAFRSAFDRREQLHHELWAIGARAAKADPTSETAIQFVRELDDLLNSHLVRSTLAASAHIPAGIMAGLIAILVLTMAMLGYQMGLRSPARSYALAPLILSVSLVVFLIIDLDRPIEGVLKISDRALIELQTELEAWR